MFLDLEREVKYKASRSSGPGGQHVNKVSSKVELLFDVNQSDVLSEKQKSIILIKLKNRISQEGVFSLKCDTTRSQSKNKTLVFSRFLELLREALAPEKKRKPSKPKRSVIEKRLLDKKKHSDKKANRNFKAE